MRLIDAESPQNRIYVSDLAIEEMKKIPTVDIDRPTRSQFKRMAAQLGYEPVVRCKECVYWMPRHVKMNDGTIRFYERNEGIVTIEKGINVGSYCKRFDDVTVHGYRDGEPCIDKTKAWCNQDDFCSYGERKNNGNENCP